MVPDGWKKSKLLNLSEFQRGFDLPKQNRMEGEIPIISSSGISGYHNESMVDRSGVVTGRYGTIGRVFFIEEPHWPLNTSLWIKDFKGNFPKFIFYFLEQFNFKKFSDKTGVPGVNRNDLHNVNVFIPPLREQKKIAEILENWNRAIEVTKKLIENSERQKKALMQQLLTGKKRLKGFSGEWQIENINNLFEILTAPSKTKYIEKGGDKLIVDMGAIDRASKLVAHKTVKQRIHPLKQGDLVMPKDDIGGGQIIGRVAYIPNNTDYELGDHVYVLRCKGKLIDPEFAYYRINEFSVRKSLRRKANGTAQLGLGKKDVVKQKISFPSLIEQKRVSDVLQNVDATHLSLTQRLKQFKLEKAALMQQLLTGKRRIKTDQEITTW